MLFLKYVTDVFNNQGKNNDNKTLEVSAKAMAEKLNKNVVSALRNRQITADTDYDVFSAEFHNMDEVVAAASFQDAGIQTKNMGTDTNVDDWQVKNK